MSGLFPVELTYALVTGEVTGLLGNEIVYSLIAAAIALPFFVKIVRSFKRASKA